MGTEQESAHKVNSGEENSPTARAGIGTCHLSITSPELLPTSYSSPSPSTLTITEKHWSFFLLFFFLGGGMGRGAFFPKYYHASTTTIIQYTFHSLLHTSLNYATFGSLTITAKHSFLVFFYSILHHKHTKKKIN